MNKEFYTVYGLLDPFSMLIRYVGITTKHPEVRLEGHLNKLEDGEKSTWIKALLSLNKKPVIVILGTSENSEEAFNLEAYWIRQGLNSNWPLLNKLEPSVFENKLSSQKEQLIIQKILEGKGISAIVEELYSVKGGRNYKQYSNEVMKIIRQSLRK